MAISVVLTLFAAFSAILADPIKAAILSDPIESTPGFDNATLAKVKANLENIATHSWEIGTALEALSELDWPTLSVFHGPVPPSYLPKPDPTDYVFAKVEAIVSNIKSPTATGPFIDGDGAVGDPASIGVPVLVVNLTRTNFGDHRFADAAKNQLNYLFTVAPRTQDGAISHRASEVQLWADFVYMAPPFIAYYGAIEGGDDGVALLTEAYRQCKLYRQYLRDDSGLWKHVVLGSWQDNNHWGTGNAWAAAGMLRVLETIARSSQAGKLVAERKDLVSWIDEILTRAWAFQHTNGTLYNYIDQDTSFADTSSTALLGATSFRYAQLTGDLAHLPSAYRALKLIKASVNADGWLLGTVDPETFSTSSAPGQYSPEGQAFVLLLQAAWRDFESLWSS